MSRIKVELLKAEGIPDLASVGRQDVYAVITVCGKKARSQVAYGGHTQPSWRQAFTFKNVQDSATLRVQVYKRAFMKFMGWFEDELVGESSVALNSATVSFSGHPQQVPLTRPRSTRPAGTITLSIQALQPHHPTHPPIPQQPNHRNLHTTVPPAPSTPQPATTPHPTTHPTTAPPHRLGPSNPMAPGNPYTQPSTQPANSICFPSVRPQPRPQPQHQQPPAILAAFAAVPTSTATAQPGEAPQALPADDAQAVAQLRSQLQELDTAGSGRVSVAQLQQSANPWLQGLLALGYPGAAACAVVRWEALLRQWPLLKQLCHGFAEYDIDGSGTITVSELRAAMEQQWRFSESEYEELLEAADSNGDDCIDFLEYCHLMAQCLSRA